MNSTGALPRLAFFASIAVLTFALALPQTAQAQEKSLYERLGGYDAIAAVADALMVRIKNDDKLRRFYDHRGADGIAREQQLLVDYLCASSGGPMVYTGRDMKTVHIGMRLDEEDWQRAVGHLTATLAAFQVPEPEKSEMLAFTASLKLEIVEVP